MLSFVIILGSDGCEDGITARFEMTQQESHKRLQQAQESFHIRQQSPSAVKHDSMSPFLQQPFSVFGQGEFKLIL